VQSFIKRLGRDENDPRMRLATGWWKVIFVIGAERRFAEFIQQGLAPAVRSWLKPVPFFFFFFTIGFSSLNSRAWFVCSAWRDAFMEIRRR
jgi:hypothetical protein